MLNFIPSFLIFLFCSVATTVFSQELPGILIKDKLSIEFTQGHGCMNQTRAASKEEALYEVERCGAVKYQLDKRGKRFTIFEKKEDKWAKWGSFTILHSYADEVQGEDRLTFLAADRSVISYIAVTESGPLVILDLAGHDYVYFVYE